MPNIYEIRKAGREYCQTEGSEHYKAVDNLGPIDLIIAKGLAEDFCLANIIKYAARFKATQNLKDLRKISDYAHILCGVKLQKSNTTKSPEPQPLECTGGYCSNAEILKNSSQTNTCREMMEALHPELHGRCPWRIAKEKPTLTKEIIECL